MTTSISFPNADVLSTASFLNGKLAKEVGGESEYNLENCLFLPNSGDF